MGYLHEGHLSLVRKSKSNSDFTVVSIFINPAQFAVGEDLEKYPRDFEKDKRLLENANVDLIFYPDKNEIYNSNFQTYVSVDKITKVLEGQFRPTHFRGVTTVVNILFNCVRPDSAYFGQKDAQQVEVIKRMVADLKMGIEIVVCSIVRDESGLAMSSRNVYLSSGEREKALTIHKSLLHARELIEAKETNAQIIVDEMKAIFSRDKSIFIDYISIFKANGFRKVEILEEGNEYYILVAAKVGDTRLIDNEFIRV